MIVAEQPAKTRPSLHGAVGDDGSRPRRDQRIVQLLMVSLLVVLDRRQLPTLEPPRDRQHEEVKRGRLLGVPFVP
jgi:hypothetical protein